MKIVVRGLTLAVLNCSAAGTALAEQETGPNFNNNLESLIAIPQDRCLVAVLRPDLRAR